MMHRMHARPLYAPAADSHDGVHVHAAGNGIDGAGDADLRMDGDDMAPKEERRLCEVGGGCMAGKAKDWGVPGIEGTGEPMP